nr:hypothetical protein TetV2_00245 [Oceanusvirus sp.]
MLVFRLFLVLAFAVQSSTSSTSQKQCEQLFAEALPGGKITSIETDEQRDALLGVSLDSRNKTFIWRCFEGRISVGEEIKAPTIFDHTCYGVAKFCEEYDSIDACGPTTDGRCVWACNSSACACQGQPPNCYEKGGRYKTYLDEDECLDMGCQYHEIISAGWSMAILFSSIFLGSCLCVCLIRRCVKRTPEPYSSASPF